MAPAELAVVEAVEEEVVVLAVVQRSFCDEEGVD